MTHLEHSEVRVRLAVCDVLCALATHPHTNYDHLWHQCSGPVLESINTHFDRDALLKRPRRPDPVAATWGDAAAVPLPDDDDTLSVSSNQSYLSDLLQHSYQSMTPGQGELRHDTEGWQCLETSFIALKSMLQSHHAQQYISADLRSLIYTALVHKNRFVRETGFYIVEAMAVHMLPASTHPSSIAALELAPQLRRGLGDNWSMVRYAACVAARAVVLRCDDDAATLQILIPPLLLNRYYVAEGVRNYSQATWRMLVGEQGGRGLAQQHMDAIVEHYLWCCKTSNHAVREAACACIAEVFEKLDVVDHAQRLLRALLVCFRDPSWPVRDAACVALGRCVMAAPGEGAVVLEELCGLLERHLSDNVPSVREDAAVSLGSIDRGGVMGCDTGNPPPHTTASIARAYPETLSSTLKPMLRRLLPAYKAQPTTTTHPPSRPRVARVRNADEDRHLFTNQPMFSCGNLLTTSVGSKAGGCGEDAGGPARAPEPWEVSDGALYLLRELARVDGGVAVEMLPVYATLVRECDWFAQSHKLRETAWTVGRALAEAVGKRAFKQDEMVFENVLIGLARSMRCGAKGCEARSEQFCTWLRNWVGHGVWGGRVQRAGVVGLLGDHILDN